MADQDEEASVEPPSIHNELALPKITSTQNAHQVKYEGPDRDGDAREADGQISGAGALVDGADEASRLRALATDVRDQDDLERDVGRQVYLSSSAFCYMLLMKPSRAF